MDELTNEPLRYESNVVDDAGLLLSPLDNLLYEMSYMKTSAFNQKDGRTMNEEEVIDRIIDSKIPKRDVLDAIMLRPELKKTYGEGSSTHEHLTSL